jgi:hypothetical protein
MKNLTSTSLSFSYLVNAINLLPFLNNSSISFLSKLSIKFLTCSLEDIKSSDKNIIDDQK